MFENRIDKLEQKFYSNNTNCFEFTVLKFYKVMNKEDKDKIISLARTAKESLRKEDFENYNNSLKELLPKYKDQILNYKFTETALSNLRMLRDKDSKKESLNKIDKKYYSYLT